MLHYIQARPAPPRPHRTIAAPASARQHVTRRGQARPDHHSARRRSRTVERTGWRRRKNAQSTGHENNKIYICVLRIHIGYLSSDTLVT